ncbi:MAG: hypothetical protein ACI4MQ_07735 [Candidatus Coproplasma sp.]
MKSWKKQLNEEFDRTVPALKDEIKNAPIITANQIDGSVVQNGNTLVKRRIGIGSVCAAAVIALVFMFMWLFGVFNTPTVPAIDRFVFTLEINPTVAFVTDKDGRVQSVNALNEDADVILSDDSTLNKLKNVPLSESIVTYTDSAAQLGYLDLSADKTAVRLSSSSETDETLLATISESLQSYFMTNGIYAVVVTDILPVSEICERLGVPKTNTLTDLTDTIKDLPALFGERVDMGADAEKLQNLYQTFVIGTQTLEYVRDELLKNVNVIVTNAQMLSQMGLCSYDIMMHKDNPFNPIPADYWTIKKYPNANYTEEFAALMTQMKNLLTEYKNEFGISLNSLSDLTSAADAYSSFVGMNFEELFANLTLNDFQSSAAKYVGILKNIGCDVVVLESILSVPLTTQEYLTQLQVVLDQLNNARKEQFKEIYEQPRDEISDVEYGDFIEEIISEYGSLENFWNKK